MTRKLFAVLNTRGPKWDHAKPMEQHDGWRAHADFMNALVAEGFIVLGGPLEGTRDVLLHDTAGLRKKAKVAGETLEEMSVESALGAIRFADCVIAAIWFCSLS